MRAIVAERAALFQRNRIERCSKQRFTPPLTLAFLLGKKRVLYLGGATRREHAVQPAGLQHMHGRW
jgi:hypothetical protein